MVVGIFLYYVGIALMMALSAFGVAFGQGLAGAGGVAGLSRQRLAFPPVRRALFLGLLLIESSGVFALLLALLYITNVKWTPTLASGLGVLGAGIGMGLAACVVGIASGKVVAAAVRAMGRQPFYASKIQNLMVITQGLLETPAILAFLIGIVIRTKLSPTMTVISGWQLLASGVLIALCAVGPAIGQSIFSSKACEALGIDPTMHPKILQFAIVTLALIETPIILGLLLSLMIMIKTIAVTQLTLAVAMVMGGVFAFGLGSIGAAVGSGYAAAGAAMSMVKTPENYSELFRLAIGIQALIDTAIVYSFIIAITLFLRAV